MKSLIDCRYIALDQFKIEEGYQPDHALLYITSGEIEFSIQGKKERAGENTLVSFPDYVHFKRKMLSPAEFYLIRYEEKDDRSMPVGKVKIEDNNRLLSSIQYLLNLNDIFGEQQIKDGFLADIFNQIKAEEIITTTKNDRIVAVAHYFFEKNLHRKITLNETAQAVRLSVSGLIFHFKNCIGMTPMEYLTAMRLEKAEALLCRTGDSIAHIASLCGYESPYYFSNTFKKHKGISPKVYRQKYGI